MSDKLSDFPKLLVVDDDEAFLAFLEELLSQSRYQVLTASNGKDGISLAMQEVPDLIILDVMMPDMSGGMAAHYLSENISTQLIPIIFLTSIISEEQEMMVDNQEGNYQFLAKPIKVDRLLSEIEKCLKGVAATD